MREWFKNNISIGGKFTIGDLIYLLWILFSLTIMVVNTIYGWWYINDIGFTIKQLIINLVVSLSTVFLFWITFKYIIIFKCVKD